MRMFEQQEKVRQFAIGYTPMKASLQVPSRLVVDLAEGYGDAGVHLMNIFET